MKRREFMRFLGIGAASFVLLHSLRAQKKMHRLAFVHSGIPADKLTESGGPFWVQKVYRTLRELGDVEGQNLVVERFSANGRSERFASLAADVVSRNPDVIIVNFNDLAKQALRSIQDTDRPFPSAWPRSAGRRRHREDDSDRAYVYQPGPSGRAGFGPHLPELDAGARN